MIYKRAEDISSSLGLDDEQVKELNDLLDQYPMLIPEYYYSLIDFNDPDDPIMKMSIPSSYEFDREVVLILVEKGIIQNYLVYSTNMHKPH